MLLVKVFGSYLMVDKLINIDKLAEYDLLLKQYIQKNISDTILRNTCDYWNSHRDFIPKDKQIVIYTDAIFYSGNYYSMIKIGDGNAYLIDIPFINEATLKKLSDHCNDEIIHITQDEREKWNKAVTISTKGERLIFNYVS